MGKHQLQFRSFSFFKLSNTHSNLFPLADQPASGEPIEKQVSITKTERDVSPDKKTQKLVDNAKMKEDFHQLVNSLGLPESEGWKQLLKNNEELDAVIGKLDHHLNSVLRKQEYEYLQAYNIYVKRKEKELRELIQALDEKNSNNNFKDLRIQQLEVTIEKMRKDAYEYEKTQEQLKKDIKVWKEKQKVESEEKEFFHKQALDAKRKNKLLKVAIGRLQVEREDIKNANTKMIENVISGDERDTDTFLTGAKVEERNRNIKDIDNFENSQALVEQNISYNQSINKRRGVSQSMQYSRQKSQKDEKSDEQSNSQKRTGSQGFKYNESRYRNIPSENLKFHQFIDLIFESKMQKDDIKFEIISYVQALETNYNQTIQEHKVRCERQKTSLRKEKAKNVNDVIERGDLENLFVDCVEDVRRNVIKRRLKAEIIGKKKIGKFDEHSAEAREFEESLLKLANLAKDRVKFSEFTSQDRNNLLDLFVNNEKTLLKIYEVLFPRKTAVTSMKTNSLRQISTLKNSSDTIQFGLNKGDFLKGDSILQRSVDETAAGSDGLQQSTVLPSILPAMNSIHSNDIINSIHGRSTNVQHMMSPDSGNIDHLMQISAMNQPSHYQQYRVDQGLGLNSMKSMAQNNQQILH